MSNLARVNLTSQQRFDISHALAMEAFTAFDFRSLVAFFSGANSAYIISGFEPTSINGLALSISVSDSVTFNPADANGSFYVGLPTDADITTNLPGSSTVFVEAIFKHITQARVSANIWNPLALTGTSVAGSEYTAAIDSQDVLQLEISSNTIGFSANAIPIMKVATGVSSITNIEDCRPLLFRLGSGGASPDPSNKFDFAATRSEPVLAGAAIGDDVNSSFRNYNSGVLNDKGIYTFKSWADAVMTRISEISGGLWYDNSSSSSFVSGITLSELFFDTIGHSIQPSAQTSIMWGYDSATGAFDYKLRSHGIGPVSWKSNYWNVQWYLGGTFASATSRSFATAATSRFVTGTVDNGDNVYLVLERDVVKGSGNPVDWIKNPFGSAPTLPWAWVGSGSYVVSGSSGDFTGIAFGDYVRRSSEGTSQYHLVVDMSDGASSGAVLGDIADSTITMLLLDDDLVTAAREPLRYFRAYYQSSSVSDIVIDDGTGVTSADYYWLGRRVDSKFIIRDYGSIDIGEEFIVFDEDFGGELGSTSDLSIVHTADSLFTSTNNYTLSAGSASTTAITINKRVNKNTTPTPGLLLANNQSEYLTFTIPVAALPIAIAAGSGLWVRLSNTTGGVALTSGTIYNLAEDIENDITTENVYEVLPAANNPLKTYNNMNVYLLARAITIGATNALLFCDGSILQEDGQYIPNNLAIKGYTRVKGGLADDDTFVGGTITPIPFADAVDYRVSQNVIGGTSVVGMINTLARSQYDEDNTGFVSWGAAAPYYSLVAGTFTLLVAGTGRMNGKPISWDGATANTADTFVSGNTYYLYIDSAGALQKSTSYPAVDVGIPLFELFYDGANYYVVKENHPYDFSTSVSWYLHNNVGTVIRGLGALATLVGGGGAGDREIQMVGADVLEDHGLATTIPESIGAVTWNMYYRNATATLTRAAQQTEMLMSYSSAGGILTALTAGQFGVHTLYVTKDTLNSSTPQYFLIVGNVNYATEAAVTADIEAGLIDTINMASAAQLAKLEFAQLGYVIVENTGAGLIKDIIISKSTFNSKVVGGGNQGAASLVSADTTYFDGMLSGADSSVQIALDTIDDYAKAANFKICKTTSAGFLQTFDVSAISASRICYVPNSATVLVVDPAGGDADKFLRATGAHTASWQSLTATMCATSVAAFDGILSAADTTVQAALNTIDDYCKSSSFKVIDGAAPTKVLDFDVSAITAGNTRTCYFPDIDSIVAPLPAAGDVGMFLIASGVGTVMWAVAGATLPIATKSADYTITASDYTVLVDATAGAIYIDLPTVVGILGRLYAVKKIDVSLNTVYIRPNGAELVEGVYTNAIPYPIDISGDSIVIQASTAGWYII